MGKPELPAGPASGVDANQLSQLRRELVISHARTSADLASSYLKWLCTSLLLVNGGALVALLSVPEIRPVLFSGAGWFFAGGMLLALLGGTASAAALSASSSYLLDRIWGGDALADESWFAMEMPRPTHRFVAGVCAGLWAASLASFVFGCVQVAEIPAKQTPAAQLEARPAPAAPVLEPNAR